MRLTAHSSAADFLRDAQGDLERREAENSLLLGAALEMAASRPGPGEPPYLAVVRDRGAFAAAALRTPPFPLLVVCEPAAAPGGLMVLLDDAARRAGRVETALLAAPLAVEAERVWERLTGHGFRPRMRQRLHVLREPPPAALSAGRLRLATEADRTRIAEWMWQFDHEALGTGTRERAEGGARRRIAAGEIVVWEDAEPRAMAGRARRTRGTVAVNAVYTPPEFRGRGYATACVAELSRRLLEEVAACVLFTDLANPTANRIYTRMGYRPLLDFVLVALRPPAAEPSPVPGTARDG